jgi:hypothetical protein
MTTYILILFVNIGALSDKDSMALTSVPGFADRAQCVAAGSAAKAEFARGTKAAAFVCVEQKRN